MSKRTSFTTLLGQNSAASTASSEKEATPTAPPTTVLMHTITGNPENPRQSEDYTDNDPEFAELMETMRLVGQLQPVAAMSHDVYVRLKPEYANDVKGAEYIVVGGNRRLAAARQLGWTRIDIRVQDRLGDDDGRLDEAVIIENIHRKKIDPIKEAEFLQRMLERHGSQDEVARRIGKSQMYVSHRLGLLKLDAEVKQEIEAGTVKPAQVRGLAAKAPEEQRAKIAEIKQAARHPKPRKKTAQNAVLKTAEHTTKPETTSAATNEGVPEPRQSPADANSGPRKFPYDDGKEAAFFLNRRMDDDQFFAMVDEVIKMANVRREKTTKAS